MSRKSVYGLASHVFRLVLSIWADLAYGAFCGGVNVLISVAANARFHGEWLLFLVLGLTCGLAAIPAIRMVFGSEMFEYRILRYMSTCLLAYLITYLCTANDFQEFHLVIALSFPLFLLPTIPLWTWKWLSGWHLYHLRMKRPNWKPTRQFGIRQFATLTAIVGLLIAILRHWYLTIEWDAFFGGIEFVLFFYVVGIAAYAFAFCINPATFLLLNSRTPKSDVIFIFWFVGSPIVTVVILCMMNTQVKEILIVSACFFGAIFLVLFLSFFVFRKLRFRMGRGTD